MSAECKFGEIFLNLFATAKLKFTTHQGKSLPKFDYAQNKISYYFSFKSVHL